MQANSTIGAPSIAGLLLVIACLPCAAQSRDGNLVVQFESWFVAPEGNELDFTTVDEATGGAAGVRTLEGERAQASRLYAGWRFGAGGGPELGMSAWQYDDDASEVVPETADLVHALLASPSMPIQSQIDAADALGDTRATAVDFDARWRLAMGHASHVVLRAGLRLFRYEGRSVVTYRDNEVDFFTGELAETAEFIHTTGDASGFGPRAGVEFSHAITPRFSVTALAGLSYPFGELDGLATETVLVDDDGPGGQNPSLAGATVADRRGSSRSFAQYEAGLRLELGLGRGWTVLAAYQMEHWSRVHLRPRPTEDPFADTVALEEVDVDFDGASIGIRYEF